MPQAKNKNHNQAEAQKSKSKAAPASAQGSNPVPDQNSTGRSQLVRHLSGGQVEQKNHQPALSQKNNQQSKDQQLQNLKSQQPQAVEVVQDSRTLVLEEDEPSEVSQVL